MEKYFAKLKDFRRGVGGGYVYSVLMEAVRNCESFKISVAQGYLKL